MELIIISSSQLKISTFNVRRSPCPLGLRFDSYLILAILALKAKGAKL